MTEKKYDILLVDDEENILSSLRRLFRKEPYRVTLARSAKEGLEKLSDGSETHVIISDYRMPGKNGVEFLKEAKKLHPHSIRMVLSGYADINAIINAINEGKIYKFMTKPWNDEELKVTVKRAVEQYELRKENRLLTQELRALNRGLEEKVEERTRELQLRNDVLLLSQEIVDSLPFAVIGIDREMVFTLINSEGKRLLPNGREILGGGVREYLPPEVVEPLKEMNTESKGMERRGVKIGGNLYNARYTPLASDGGLRGYVITFLEEG